VAKGRILIIEQDEWESTLLAKFLGEAGYEVHIATEARAGFDKVRQLQPDCILCDVNLPDIDGFWVARRVRTEATQVATAPFLFFTDAGDTESRLQGLNVGADIYLTRPFHDEEVVAQVGALIEMAKRLRTQGDSFSNDGPVSSTAGNAAFQGDIAQMSVATVLTLLDLERRTGHLKVRSEAGKVGVLELNEGALAGASLDSKPHDPTQLLREILRWKKGSFSFRGAVVSPPTGARQTIGQLLIEAMRQEDESRR
jgi:DNA-binding response OmpR family regulator